ncbi:MAG: FAD-dependent oxidoreductase [Eubacteriaceae bacterium]|nr:FAD-dependent oxidoreductase [Eubacteriaceae bacterium]
MEKTILEPASNIPIHDEVDIIVVGGGPAGSAAAISAARNGAKVALLERYGFLGGQASGGLVLVVPNLDNGTGPAVRGIQQEWMDRLAHKPDGVYGPKLSEAGSSDPELVRHWKRYLGAVYDGKISYTTLVDPEWLKIVLLEMAIESNVKLMFHCWGCKAITEGNKATGVIFESKEGRRAILGKMVIDATGEGDIFASAGADFYSDMDLEIRNSNMSVPFRLANVDYSAWMDSREADPDKWPQQLAELVKIAGFRLLPLPLPRNDNVFVNNWIVGRDSMKVADLTNTEIEIRSSLLPVIQYLKKNVTGFENVYLMDTASVIGSRHSRRVKGLYTINYTDFLEGKEYDDVIAVTPAQHLFNRPGDEIAMQIPYRALIPEKIDGIIAAGRCVSADVKAHNWLNLIPHSVATGEAAGAAAYVSINSGVEPRDADVAKIQQTLKDQGFWLP